ncbi:Fic family protein [Streptomyces caeruleatus]|uniref:Cell filamentation protein Fic n=1 Tax=Streptomyces caeruleatus TaxID=661399 RepID=A0A101TU40_9ACTN|nr:Fic family protein [Streptomyces caeruleatus]KUN98511.1 cell filamentation protein Fic [Streptomyces caeruleatus]
MLYRTPALASKDREVLESIDKMRHELRHQVLQTPTKWTAGLRKTLTAEAIAGSNTIEGYKVDSVDAEDLLDGELEVAASEENKAETLAYQHAMTYVQSLHDVADFTYSKSLLNALHWMLQGHHHPRKLAGQWRRDGVWINEPGRPQEAAYVAPDADRIPALMDELVTWLNESDPNGHVLVRAAMAHLILVKIHPWADGNGRMSRSLQTLLIARGGVLAPEFSSIESWLGAPVNTWEYYKILSRVGGKEWSPDRDTAPWIRFNLLAYHQQSQSVQHRITRSNRCWIDLTEYAEHHGIDERQVTALHAAALAGRVRRARYQRAENLSNQQAVRDVRALTEAGLLEAVGNTKARYYVPGANFPPEVLEAVRRPIRLVDPYED